MKWNVHDKFRDLPVDEELMDIVRDLDIFGDNPSITIKRSESGFTFVNFNFES
ncbi:MAG: hypothetical protein PF574_06875 [Candidatus Delongbacteria bacterium]|jgi:hypothetical protein|nr:hypothetical protein [Candidatus Delongbacteria bacterium]